MLSLTDAATRKLRELFAADERRGLALRCAIAGRGPGGWQYRLAFASAEDRRPDDVVHDGGGFEVWVDAESAPRLAGATLDWVENLMGAGFSITNPNAVWDDPVSNAVQAVLDEDINPAVAQHGGFVQLLEVRGDTAFVLMGGGCQGCGLANVTLKQGVEVRLRERVPEILHVVDTTDHAGGNNPYYRPAKGAGDPGGASPLAG
jgi:Fe/S biogenesis protein NfuA